MSDEFKDIPVLDVDYHLREYDDIVVRLGNVGGFDSVAELCSEARDYIISLRAALREKQKLIDEWSKNESS